MNEIREKVETILEKHIQPFNLIIEENETEEHASKVSGQMSQNYVVVSDFYSAHDIVTTLAKEKQINKYRFEGWK